MSSAPKNPEEFTPERIYYRKARIGNWFEDLCVDDDEDRIFLGKRAQNELIIQKSRKLFSNFFKEIDLNSVAEYIKNGDKVQIIPCCMNLCKKRNDNDLALSVVINQRLIQKSQKMSTDCEITVAESIKPCVRNVFVLERSADANQSDGNFLMTYSCKTQSKELLKYGEEFMIKCITPEDEDELFLFSAPKAANVSVMVTTTFMSKYCGEINYPVGLCTKKDFGLGKEMPTKYVKWICVHENPAFRFQTNGLPVPNDKPLIIRHAATNQSLAAEAFEIATMFGQECLVSAHTYTDVHKRETWQNIWKFKIG